MAVTYTPEAVLKLIDKAHECAARLESSYDHILEGHDKESEQQAPISNEEVARKIVAAASAYGALAHPAAYFGHDPAPFSLGERLGKVLARSLLVKRLQNVEVSPSWGLGFWTKHAGGTVHPTDAIVKLEMDMLRLVEIQASDRAKEPKQKKKRGRDPVDAGEARKRHNIVKAYKQRSAGTTRKDFAASRGITPAYLQKCLTWGRKRKARSADKTVSSTK